MLWSLLHEGAAQFSINLASHALNLNDFDKRRLVGAEFLHTFKAVIEESTTGDGVPRRAKTTPQSSGRHLA